MHPPIAEGAAGFARLDDVMTAVEDLGFRMGASSGLEPWSLLHLDHASGRPEDQAFTITPTGDKKLTAGPQVTTGLNLAKIPLLKSRSKTDVASSGLLQDEPVPKLLANTIAALSSQANKIHGNGAVPYPSQALRGLLTVIINYLQAGADRQKDDKVLDRRTRYALALTYPKQIADDALLARTDFARLFTPLPRREQASLKKYQDAWFNLVLSNTDPRLTLTKRDSVIGRGIQNHETDDSKGLSVPDLTIGDWLGGMVYNVDLLPLIKDPDSMGQFGPRAETVGGTTGALFDKPVDAGIFEFRGAQTNKIPLTRWGPFAREFHRYITRVHARPHAH